MFYFFCREGTQRTQKNVDSQRPRFFAVVIRHFPGLNLLRMFTPLSLTRISHRMCANKD
jgi:hypothetical protein